MACSSPIVPQQWSETGSVTLVDRTRSGRLVAYRSMTLLVLPSKEYRVGSIIICVRPNSVSNSIIFVPAVLGADVSSQDGCFALNSPRSVTCGDSSSAFSGPLSSVKST